MLENILSCLQEMQLFFWQRRALPKERTYHVGSFPVEWYCASALDRLAKEEFVVRDKGIVCFRSDTRSPKEIFKNGFNFEASVENFTRLYCYNQNERPTTGCCIASLAALACFPKCCCGLAPYILTAECGCILCSYFINDAARFTPTKLCAMDMASEPGSSTASTLSFSMQARGAARYPLGFISTQPGASAGAFLYLCYVPAPYVNFAKLTKKVIADTARGASEGLSSMIDDEEIFPLGAPTLDAKYIIGAWKLQSAADDATSKFEFQTQRAMLAAPHKIVQQSFEVNDRSTYYQYNPAELIWARALPPEFFNVDSISRCYEQYKNE